MDSPTTFSLEDIVSLARELIRIPSRAGLDPIDPIINAVAQWCDETRTSFAILETEEAGRVGLYLHISSGVPGPCLCLDACIDTAPFGDEAQWKHGPTSAVVERGRIYGRGSADSKTAASLFLHLAREIKEQRLLRRGDLYVLLDADEHTGKFGGVKEFVRTAPRRPDAVWIGYPGNNTIVAGSRGFLRARVSVFGISAHTGSKRRKGVNAISRAAKVISTLEQLQLPSESDPEFAFGPSITVTAIGGGEGFSVVPDKCTFNLDVRLTPHVNLDVMKSLIETAVRDFDGQRGSPRETELYWEESWPAFRESDASPTIASIRHAAEQHFRRSIPTTVSGPSNIGNYFASFGIGAMSGFGVTYDNVHAGDEWCEIESIAPVYLSYLDAIKMFMETMELPSEENPSQTY